LREPSAPSISDRQTDRLGQKPLGVAELVADRHRPADHAVVGQHAPHADAGDDEQADEVADDQDADHQPEDAEQQVRLAVDRRQAHEQHHRDEHEAGE
jgi:hypothetical protein